MSTQREELDLGLPGMTVTAVPRMEEPSKSAEFGPHRSIDLAGTLACAQPVPRMPAGLTALCLPALVTFVEQVSLWGPDSGNPESRLGDYRFLVVDFTNAAGICRYAQIWSEPQGELTMEVGPGDRDDAVLQASADSIRPVLTGRGFEIGGNANNFRKHLVAPSAGDCRRVAHELLTILTEVLQYDGTTDLTYRLHQNTHLTADHVIDGISRSQLFDYLKAWGFRPSRTDDTENVLKVRDRDLGFQVLLRVRKVTPKDDYWEIHCFAIFPLRPDAAAELLQEFNATPGLFKVFAASDEGASTRDIGIATGINLVGGVTLEHIRAHIMEWLEAARKLRYHRARQSEPPVPAERSQALN
jgi:hypothetical protein